MKKLTQRQLISDFWQAHPDFIKHGRRKQNAYPADVRMAFCDYVDFMHRNGNITDDVAHSVILH